MKSLTWSAFNQWLARYSQASQENNARASAELFTQDALYYETPFEKPLIGREAIYHYWRHGAETLKDNTASHKILSVHDNLGIARWQAQFVNSQSGQRAMLDCVFVVEFDEYELCSVFREWWHLTKIDADPDGEIAA
jgi:hypothetical protein